jgi:hypothetical protein
LYTYHSDNNNCYNANNFLGFGVGAMQLHYLLERKLFFKAANFNLVSNYIPKGHLITL